MVNRQASNSTCRSAPADVRRTRGSPGELGDGSAGESSAEPGQSVEPERVSKNRSATPASISVTLPTLLLRLFPGSVRRLDLPAATVAELIDALDGRWPGMRDRLCDSRPRLRRHINVFVAGARATLETPLAPGTEVIIMTAISGG
jgi:molybdopterin converting factor small subunit